MSDVLELRTWSDLSPQEKQDIITRVASAWEDKPEVKRFIAIEYNVSEWTINSLMAHETMRRNSQKPLWDNSPISTRQELTQNRVYKITNIAWLAEEVRVQIVTEFREVMNDHSADLKYDYYLDIEAMADYYDCDPWILEQFLRNAFQYLWEKLEKIKDIRTLWEEEKLSIRRYVQDWIDEKEKKRRRREMATQHNVSVHTIWALTAWKLWDDGSISLWKHHVELEVPHVNTLTTKENTTIHILDWDLIDTSFIYELANEFNLRDNDQRKSFLADVFDCFPEATIDDIKRILPEFPDDADHLNERRSGEWMWALVNYNNEIKNKWRQKLKEFIDQNTDPAKRKGMKVLCLPGIECLEIPLYLELWFLPENIVWVEAGIVRGKKDPEIIERFLWNAQKYGIQVRIGKLEKILETEDTVFDVVSLDFLGPISANILSIGERLRLVSSPIILMNTSNKREQKDAQYTLIQVAHAQQIYTNEYNKDAAPDLQTARHFWNQWILTTFFGRNGIPDITDINRFDKEFTIKIKDSLSRFLKPKWLPIDTHWHYPDQIASAIITPFSYTYISKKAISSSKRYTYRSSISAQWTTYLSDFVHLENMINLQVHPALQKIYDILFGIFSEDRDFTQVWVYVTNKEWRVRSPMDKSHLRSTDGLTFSYWNTKKFISFKEVIRLVEYCFFRINHIKDYHIGLNRENREQILP